MRAISLLLSNTSEISVSLFTNNSEKNVLSSANRKVCYNQIWKILKNKTTNIFKNNW